MPANTKLIKARIKSIQNTKKVTKAMELVAAAKMRRAVEVALETREYSKAAWSIALRLATSNSIESADYLHNFFRSASKQEKFLLIAFASNRGLCGAYNSGIIKKVVEFVEKRGKENVEIIAVGKRIVSALSVVGIKPQMAYEKKDSAKRATSVINIANYSYEKFKKEKVDEVWVAYTDYQSSLLQNAVIIPLFPFQKNDSITAGVDFKQEENDNNGEVRATVEAGYVHEPTLRKVLSYMVPRLGEVQLFQALLESNASEHSARMVAMKNANDSAAEMLEGLVLQYNQARQATITQEIAEISAGMAAVT